VIKSLTVILKNKLLIINDTGNF